jgi:hypothetical protein
MGMFMNVNKLRKLNKILWIIILATVVFNILFLMRYNFEADSAFLVTLAQEQIRTKSLFPEGIYYSTGLFVLTPNLFVIPFLCLTQNLVLARQLAILLLWLFIYWLLYKLFVLQKIKNETGFIIASSLFSILHIDASVVSMHFYQGAYVSYLFFELLFLGIINKIITEDAYNKKNYACILAVYSLANLGELRNLLIWGIPAFLSYALYVFLKTKNDCCSICDLKNEKLFIRILFISIVICLFISVMLAKQFETFGTTNGLSVLLARDFNKSLSSILIGLLTLFGNAYTASLFSVGGIARIVNFIVAIAVIFILPVLAVKRYNTYRTKSDKFLILFLMISTAVYLLVTFLTGVSITTDRYLIPVYNNIILLTAIVVSDVLRRNLHTRSLIVVTSILVYVFMTNFFFLGAQKDSLLLHSYGHFAEGVAGVHEFLESKGLAYGYATFENAEEYSILSNNRVRIRSVFFADDKVYSYNWLTSKYFYDESYYRGKTFLMITDKQLEEHFPCGIEKLDLGEPVSVYKYKKFKIFVYDYNIGRIFRRDAKLYHINQGGMSYMGINFGE